MAKRAELEAFDIEGELTTPIKALNDFNEDAVMEAAGASPDHIQWKIFVYKLDKDANNAEDFIFNIEPHELDGLLTRLRDKNGTGTYRVRVYRKDGLQRQAIFAQFDRRVKAPDQPSMPSQPPSEMAAVLSAIQTSNDKTLQVLERLVDRQQVPQSSTPAQSPFAAITEMATAMGVLMKIIQPAQATSATDMILKGVELRDKLAGGIGGNDGGDEDGEISLMGLIKTALQMPAVQDTVKTILQPVQAPVETPPSQGQVKPQILGTTMPTLADPQTQAAIKQAVMYLNSRAMKGTSPLAYADWVFDNWPVEMVSMFLQHPHPEQLVVSFVPETAPNLPWFQKLIEELRKLVNDAVARQQSSAQNAPGNPATNNPDGNTGRGGGSESDVADDEETSQWG